jgi:hypothetical protein
MAVSWLMKAPLSDALAMALVRKSPELFISEPVLRPFALFEIKILFSPDPLAVRALFTSPPPSLADSSILVESSRL